MKFIKNSAFIKIFASTLILFGTLSLKAEFSDWTKPFVGPGQKISTLIITGNYAKPRIIAELIQDSTRQPILLLPASGQSGIYFMPPEKDGGKAMKIPDSEMTNFINFLGVKQIVVLGDSKYVSDNYYNKISEVQTVCRVSAKNWQRVADTLGSFLNLPNLPGDYKTLAAKMTNEINYKRADQTGVSPSDQSMPVIEDIQPLSQNSVTDASAANVPTNESFVIDASQK